MPVLLSFLICLMTTWGLAHCTASPQAEKPLWTNIPQQQWKEKGIAVKSLEQYRVLELDTAGLRRLLESGKEKDIRQNHSLLLLPLPDGSQAGFIFAPSVTTAQDQTGHQAGSRTYFGQGAKDASLGLAFDLGPAGFHAMITRGGETVFIEPLNLEGRRYYVCFFKHHLKPGFKRPFGEFGPIQNPNNR